MEYFDQIDACFLSPERERLPNPLRLVLRPRSVVVEHKWDRPIRPKKVGRLHDFAFAPVIPSVAISVSHTSIERLHLLRTDLHVTN